LSRGLVAWLAFVLGVAAAAPAFSAAVAGYPQTLALPAGAKAGDLKLQPCVYRSEPDGKDYGADCGLLVVPENRRAAASRLIALPVIRIRATVAGPAEPIFTFQGGPGASNAINFSIGGLLAHHDVVMWSWSATGAWTAT
jgi:hypothetical protein